MNNILYRRIVRSAMDTPSGETPDAIAVTEETNGYAVWACGHDGDVMLQYFPVAWEAREEAMECAVSKAQLRIKRYSKDAS